MSTKKIVIGGIIVVIAVITIVGSIGIVMSRETTSPSVDAAAPNPNTYEELDVSEYGLSLNYDGQYGDLTYANTDNDGTPGQIITVSNDTFAVPEKCTGKDTYKTMAQFVVSDAKDATVGSFDETGDIYVKVGAKYFGLLPYKLNLPIDDACYDKTTASRYYAQQQSLYDSFKALKENTANP